MSKEQISKTSQILKLARQGNPNVIAAMLNHKLQHEGIIAKVKLHDSCLLVLLEADPAPLPGAVVRFIYHTISKLKPNSINTVKILGRSLTEKQPAWRKQIKLESIPVVLDLSTWLESGSTVRTNQVDYPVSWQKNEQNFQGNQSQLPLATSVKVSVDAELPPQEKFLRFQVGSGNGALLQVNCIQAILNVSVPEILPIPHTADSVIGIYNWRGEMLWLLDLNSLLGFPGLWQPKDMPRTKIMVIVLQVNSKLLGLVVSQVEEIEQHHWENLQPPDRLLPLRFGHFVKAYIPEASSIILDAQRIVQAALDIKYEV
ncbi:chemotaxis protein CheW [Moorena producens]|uniref:chemotaxis protein CheW n=1 Tax=Moorena producens TaxID=1155739 RepID=UPI001314C185|nr:chemotaxis protein CheW [Moorena producens]